MVPSLVQGQPARTIDSLKNVCVDWPEVAEVMTTGTAAGHHQCGVLVRFGQGLVYVQSKLV